MFDLENLNILNLSEPADNTSKSDSFNENSFDEYRAALNDAKSFLHRVIIVSKARLILSLAGSVLCVMPDRISFKTF